MSFKTIGEKKICFNNVNKVMHRMKVLYEVGHDEIYILSKLSRRGEEGSASVLVARNR